MMVGPLFTHDCVRDNCCQFVGSTLTCDVYIYGSMLGEPGMIMRHSSDGADYSSYPAMRYAHMAAAQNNEVQQAVQLVAAFNKPVDIA